MAKTRSGGVDERPLEEQVREAMEILSGGQLFNMKGKEIPTSLVDRARGIAMAASAEAQHANELAAELRKLKEGVTSLWIVSGSLGQGAHEIELVCSSRALAEEAREILQALSVSGFLDFVDIGKGQYTVHERYVATSEAGLNKAWRFGNSVISLRELPDKLKKKCAPLLTPSRS